MLLVIFSLALILGVGEIFGQSGKLVITNNSGVSRTEDPVVISRQEMSELIDIPNSGKKLALSIKGKPIPAQLDDLNQDGKWDELAFQLDIDRNSKVEIKMKWVDPEDEPVFPKRVQLWFGVSENRDGKYQSVTRETRPDVWTPGMQPPRYQMEGPSWENEKVGFRQYFDSRNQKDVFGKTKPGLVLDSVDRFYKDFHKPGPWGMDVLNTESSMGAGGFAMMDKGIPAPLVNTEYVRYQQIAYGPARVMFDVVYEGWDVKGSKYNVRERVSIWAGKYWYKNEMVFTGFTGEKEIAVGISASRKEVQPIYKTNNRAFTSLCSHDRQSENDDMLGMGLLFSTKIFGGYGETPRFDPLPKRDSLSHSIYATLKIRSGQPIEYQFFACWEKSELKFGNAKYFTDTIQDEADRNEYPLLIGNK